MTEKLWWQKPLRVIQTNLQVRDTPSMDPEKIAGEIQAMEANVLVMNAGGIYAWYPSKVPFHHINEFLPQDKDLLADLIEASHRRGIKVVARFDFSKTDDHVYQQRPWWFVRDAEGAPVVYGKERPGDWSLLYTTCLNSGYRGSDFAVPVVEEVIRDYRIDGVFLNAPHYEFCTCSACKEKYQQAYGKELPLSREELEPDWPLRSVQACITQFYQAIKELDKDMPMILYYGARHREDLYERLAMSDMLCTEAQNILSRGCKDIPQAWEPAVAMKAGCAVDMPAPFGIIHSCPGMDWRHTGLPQAEYRFWLSQIPANGGSIWHSLTGFPDTISDKRLLQAVTEVNHKTALCEADMVGAESAAETVLLWNGSPAACGWFDAMITTHQQFDLLDEFHLSAETIGKYRTAVLPEGFDIDEARANVLKGYVELGGNLIAEGCRGDQLEKLRPLLGVSRFLGDSGYQAASYLRLEDRAALGHSLEEIELLPHRGCVLYCAPEPGVSIPMTFVPPFAPLDAVGAPPERASILCPRTDIPMALLNQYGSGKVLFLPFQLSMLIREYRLADHYRLAANAIACVGGSPILDMKDFAGVQAVLYRKGDDWLAHLVNGVGQRPLVSTTKLRDVSFSIRLDGEMKEARAESALAGAKVDVEISGGYLHCNLSELEVWDMIRITAK